MSRQLTMAFLLSATLLVLIACASTPPAQEQQASYIVQGKDLTTVTNAVRSVGGEITHELGIIRAVGAELTPSQVERLRAMDGLSIHDNSTIETASLAVTGADDLNFAAKKVMWDLSNIGSSASIVRGKTPSCKASTFP